MNQTMNEMTPGEIENAFDKAGKDSWKDYKIILNNLPKYIWSKIIAMNRRLLMFIGGVVFVILIILFTWMIRTKQFNRPISRNSMKSMRKECLGYHSSKFDGDHYRCGPPVLMDITDPDRNKIYFNKGNFTMYLNRNYVIVDIKRGKRRMKHPIEYDR